MTHHCLKNQAATACSSNVGSAAGSVQMRLRSPYTLSTRPETKLAYIDIRNEFLYDKNCSLKSQKMYYYSNVPLVFRIITTKYPLGFQKAKEYFSGLDQYLRNFLGSIHFGFNRGEPWGLRR